MNTDIVIYMKYHVCATREFGDPDIVQIRYREITPYAMSEQRKELLCREGVDVPAEFLQDGGAGLFDAQLFAILPHTTRPEKFWTTTAEITQLEESWEWYLDGLNEVDTLKFVLDVQRTVLQTVTSWCCDITERMRFEMGDV